LDLAFRAWCFAFDAAHIKASRFIVVHIHNNNTEWNPIKLKAQNCKNKSGGFECL
jgi:hypothetical protein